MTTEVLLLLSLVCLGVCGLVVFVVYYIRSFEEAGQSYEYSCPLTAMWAGLAIFWYSVDFVVWCLCSRFLKRPTGRNAATLAWIFFSGLFAVEGFVSVLGLALAQNEGLAAGWTSLWLACGVIGIVLCRVLLQRVESGFDREEDQQFACNENSCSEEDVERELDTNEKNDTNAPNSGPSQRRHCFCEKRLCSCCCTATLWLDLISLVLAALLVCFSSAFMVQSVRSASNSRSYSPPGKIYTVEIREGLNVRMHLYCYGGNSTKESTVATVIFEHGGGSNHASLLALADQVESTFGSRVCLYDRLGYGFTPTLYTSAGEQWRLPNGGIILSKLLDEAGERGPFVCAGHSAGAEQCLWLAHLSIGSELPESRVMGVALMDGYPDLISPGSIRPGQPQTSAILDATRQFAFWVGATGLLYGVVGNAGPDFVLESSGPVMVSLYGQVRFWLSQFWDVRSSFDLPEEEQLHNQLKGYQDGDGLFHYGGTLSGVKILVLPAYETVTMLDCSSERNQNEFCCIPENVNNQWCIDQAADKSLYLSQAQLYSSTLSNDTEGTLIIAPEGSKHDFVYHRDFFKWVSGQIGEQLLMGNYGKNATA